MSEDNFYENAIKEALEKVQRQGNNPEEDGRTKALVVTKLQEALLWAGKIYDPFK